MKVFKKLAKRIKWRTLKSTPPENEMVEVMDADGRRGKATPVFHHYNRIVLQCGDVVMIPQKKWTGRFVFDDGVETLENIKYWRKIK